MPEFLYPQQPDHAILVLGGAGVNSIGRASVDKFYVDYPETQIYVGTTSQENFDRVRGQYEKKGQPTDRLHPFVANVTDKLAVARAADQMKDNGHQLRVTIYGQAGGMEGFMPQLISDYLSPIREFTRGKPLHTLNPYQQRIIREIMDPMYQQIKAWRKENIPNGIAVNYKGTFNAQEVLIDKFPEGFLGIFLNSTWGHLSGVPGVEIPLLYGPVDLSKAMVRDRLRITGEMLHQQGYPHSELVASLVRKTRVGKTFQDYLMPLSDPEQAEAIKNSAIDPIDVVKGQKIIINSDPDSWLDHPFELFVTGKDGAATYSNKLDMSAMYSTPYPY